MKQLLSVWLLALTLVACGSGSGGDTPPAPPAPPPAPTGPTPAEQLATDLAGLDLGGFYFESFGALMKRSPESLLWRSLEDVYPPDAITLDDLSDDYRRDTFAMARVVLDLLRTYDRNMLDAAGRINYDVYEWYLQDIVDREAFIYHGFPASYGIFGTQEETRQLFTEIHPLATLEDAEAYISRLGRVNTKFSQLSALLELQRQNGIVEPALSLQIALDGVTALATGATGGNPYYRHFVNSLPGIAGLTSDQRADLEARAFAAVDTSVKNGYNGLRLKLESLRGSAPSAIGVGQYPQGSDYYAYALRRHTTSNLTAAEIHQLGLDELTRIQAEMRTIFDQLGYPQNETLQQLYARVASDGGIIPAASVRKTYEDIIEIAAGRLDQAFDIFPSADVIVIPDDFGGYYIGPSFDGSRPGAFYAGTTRDEPWFGMPSLAYHEALPGHHTQIAIAMDQDVPVFRKIARFTGFVEGWALYAERLAFELGWYDGDPYGNLGRLQYEALRAARLVMDTGIHSLNWSFDQAAQFNEENVGWSTGASQGAAARYSVWPGQATAYLIGMLQILDERQRAQDALGADFDLIAFHRALLSNGAVPLPVLTSVVDAYIDSVQGTQ